MNLPNRRKRPFVSRPSAAGVDAAPQRGAAVERRFGELHRSCESVPDLRERGYPGFLIHLIT